MIVKCWLLADGQSTYDEADKLEMDTDYSEQYVEEYLFDVVSSIAKTFILYESDIPAGYGDARVAVQLPDNSIHIVDISIIARATGVIHV